MDKWSERQTCFGGTHGVVARRTLLVAFRSAHVQGEGGPRLVTMPRCHAFYEGVRDADQMHRETVVAGVDTAFLNTSARVPSAKRVHFSCNDPEVAGVLPCAHFYLCTSIEGRGNHLEQVVGKLQT